MRHLLGYLQLETPDGDCVEIINGARTLALMRHAAAADPTADPTDACRMHSAWRLRDIATVWQGNDCWAFNSGQYGVDPTRWDDPLGTQDLNPWEGLLNPGTAEVAGFLPDAPAPGLGVILESPTESRIMESDRIEPLELVITGTVVAGTSRGESAWLQWANRELTNCRLYQRPMRATVFTHCADEDDWAAIADPADIPPDPSGEPVYTSWDDATPNELEAWAGSTPWPLDAGLWQLFDVQFLSIDPLNDQPLFPHCVGRRYALRFSVGRHHVYDRPRTLATLGGAGNWSAGETYSNPLEVGTPVLQPDPAWLGPPGIPVPTQPGRHAGLLTRSGRWSLPDECLRVAALTPPRAQTLADQLVVEMHNPSTQATVYNARVRFWEALVGYPHPNTQVGDVFYRDREPVAELRIVRIEPSETLIYDGREKRVRLRLPGRPSYDVVPGRLESQAGARAETPPLRCDRRYWAAVELSADPGSYGDLDLEVTVRAAMEMIPT